MLPTGERKGNPNGYAGFWGMARRYWRTGTYDMYRFLSKTAFVFALQRLVPEIRSDDLGRGGAAVLALTLARLVEEKPKRSSSANDANGR